MGASLNGRIPQWPESLVSRWLDMQAWVFVRHLEFYDLAVYARNMLPTADLTIPRPSRIAYPILATGRIVQVHQRIVIGHLRR